ncbi:MAG: hypothetical protein K0B02_05375 [DPANN group archaeon]|nr:hypothetical protein [DPANN group archaeon]
MVKIKNIKVNGLRGFKNLPLDNIRSPQTLNFKLKNVFILGENGTGKSSLYDVLEWCITGDCEESKNRRCNCNEFLKNKNTDYSLDLLTEIEFEDNNKLSRCLDGKTSLCNPIISPSPNGITHDFSDASFIDINRINKFVLDAPANLWKAFSELLNFEELREFDKKLIALKNEVTKKYDPLNDIFEHIKRKKIELSVEISNLKNSMDDMLGIDWESKMDYFSNQIKDPNKYKYLEKTLTLFYNIHETLGKYQLKINNLENKKKEININIDDSKLKIINSADDFFNKYFDIKECPICHNTNIDTNKIRNQLSKIKSQNKDFTQLNETLIELNSLMKKESQELNLQKENITKLLTDLNLSDFISKNNLDQINKLLKLKPDLMSLIEKNSSSNIILTKQYVEKIKELTNIEKKYNEIEKEFKTITIIKRDITKYQDVFSQTYKNKIQSELDSLSKDIVFKIYNDINQSEHDKHIEDLKINVSKLEETNPLIDFKVKINGVYEDAVSTLSTGHLKCLGFALLMANFKINSTKIKTLFVDDPIYAIDHEHRYNLIKYFHSLSNEGIQLILFSSDRLFFEILITSFNYESYVALKSNWNLSEGVNYKPINGSCISKAKEHLRQKDIRATALYTRLSLEHTLFKIAKNLKLKIPYDKINSIGMKQLIGDYRIESVFKEQYSDYETEIGNVFKELKQPKCSKILLGTFGLDPELHYVHESRDSYTLIETNEIVTLVEQFITVTERIISARDSE